MGSARQNGFVDAAMTSLCMVAVLFLILALEIVVRHPLMHYGILPRTIIGLRGVAFSPLLHQNFNHVFSNAFPLFVMLLLLQTHRGYRPWETLGWIWVVSGLGTWLIGRPAMHIGASSLVFGLAAFLIVAGFQVKSWKPILIALLVFFFYGGIFIGALPQNGPISWEGHLCGAIAGVWRARVITK